MVPSRDAFTLLNLIYKHCAPNSIIFSDCWASYARIRQLDKHFEHLTVNHDLYFVNPENGVHTNGVESNWCAAKAPFKQMRGVSRKFLAAYLDEFSWRRLQGDQVFEALLNAIAKHHPPGIDQSLTDVLDKFENINIVTDDDELAVDDEMIEIPPLPDYENIIGEDTDIVVDSNAVVVDSNAVVVGNNAVVVESSDVVVGNNAVVVESSDVVVESNDVVVDNKAFITEKIKNIVSDGGFYKFSKSLASTDRQLIHELTELHHLTHQTSGTRYKCITISKESPVQNFNNRQKTAIELQNIANYPIPSSENVAAILSVQPMKKIRKPRNNSINEKKNYNLRKRH